MENMDCPNCNKDLQPFPFDMILPDPMLQTLVDKLFPEAVEADYQEEMQFYLKRRLPLPERLASRGNRLNRSFEDLDSSITAMSEADSEMMSESQSLDVSLVAPELAATSSHPATFEKMPPPASSDAATLTDAVPITSSTSMESENESLDKQIEELVAQPAHSSSMAVDPSTDAVHQPATEMVPQTITQSESVPSVATETSAQEAVPASEAKIEANEREELKANQAEIAPESRMDVSEPSAP